MPNLSWKEIERDEDEHGRPDITYGLFDGEELVGKVYRTYLRLGGRCWCHSFACSSGISSMSEAKRRAEKHYLKIKDSQ